MAVQIQCFNCGKKFLMRSDNTDIIQLDDNKRKVEITCPLCRYIQFEYLLLAEIKTKDIPRYVISEDLLADSVPSTAFEQAQKEILEEIEKEERLAPRELQTSAENIIPDGPLPYRRIRELDEKGNPTGAYRIEGQPRPGIEKSFIFPPDEYRDRLPSVGPEDFGGEDFPSDHQSS